MVTGLSPNERKRPVAHPLPPVMDLAGALDLHRALRAACARGSAIAVNGAGVERVSTACLQVLAAAARAVREGGHDFTLEAPSPALSAALDDLGLAAILSVGDAA